MRKKISINSAILGLFLSAFILSTRSVSAITVANCLAGFYSDSNLTQTISSFKAYKNSLGSPYCISPNAVYVAFPIDATTDFDKSDIQLYTQLPLQGTQWFGLKNGGSDASVSIITKGSQNYLVGRIETTTSSPACANSILNPNTSNRLNFRAVVDGTQCTQENILPTEWVNPSCVQTSNVCKNPDGTYNIGFSATYNNFIPGEKYLIYEGKPGGTTLQQNVQFFPPTSSGSLPPDQNLGFTNYHFDDTTSQKTFCISQLGTEAVACSASICKTEFYLPEEACNGFPFPTPADQASPSAVPFSLCEQAGSKIDGGTRHEEYLSCMQCFDQQGIWTGVGCIPYNNRLQTVKAFIILGLGIAGSVVIMMTLAAGFLLSTSQGDPKRVDEAKSLITSAVSGALFIIFSVTILRFIGVNILQLPAFG